MASKAKTLVKGSMLRTLYFFASVLVGLYLMPLMIHSLGDELYGLWMFIASLMGFYLLFDMGLGSAIQRYVSRAIGKEDYTKANVIVNTAFFLFSAIGIFVICFSFALAYILPLLLKNITHIRLFRIVMIILGVNLAVSLPMKVFSGILTSHLRFDIQTNIELFKLFLRAALVVLFLKLGHGVIAVALVFCSADLLGYLLLYLFTKKAAPYITFDRRFFDKTRIRELYSYSWKTLIAQVADKLRFNIDNFVIVGFLGLNFVTIYAIAARLVRHFINLTTSTVGMLTPVFSQYESKGDFRSIREKFILTTKISSYLAIFVGGSIIIFGKAFIERWMGPEYLGAYPLLVVLTIPITIALMQNPSIQLLYGISKHNFYAISNSVEGVANLILSLILVQHFGLVGVALGTAIPMVVIKLFIQPVYVCKNIGLNVSNHAKLVLTALAKSSMLWLVIWIIFRNLIVPHYFYLVCLIGASLVIFFFFIIICVLNNMEKEYFKKICLTGFARS